MSYTQNGLAVIGRINKVTKANSVIIYSFKFNNKSAKKWCQTCSKLTIKTSDQNDVNDVNIFIIQDVNVFFIVNFEHISSASIVDFEQVNVCWKDIVLQRLAVLQ